jgi:hypothetical protein
MPILNAKILKKESGGDGLVEFDRPDQKARCAVFSSRTENIGRIWAAVKVGSRVRVDVEFPRAPDLLPRVKRIELIR